MECERCKSFLPETAKFCPECGCPVNLTCPSCQQAVSPSHKYCLECGSKLKGKSVDPQFQHSSEVYTAPNEPFLFIPGPADDCSEHEANTYLTWLEKELFPNLKMKNVSFKTYNDFVPGSKCDQITDMQRKCTHVVIPVCNAICTKMNSMIIATNFSRKAPIVLNVPVEVGGTADKNWGGLNFFYSYDCKNECKLDQAVQEISKLVNTNNEIPASSIQNQPSKYSPLAVEHMDVVKDIPEEKSFLQLQDMDHTGSQDEAACSRVSTTSTKDELSQSSEGRPKTETMEDAFSDIQSESNLSSEETFLSSSIEESRHTADSSCSILRKGELPRSSDLLQMQTESDVGNRCTRSTETQSDASEDVYNPFIETDTMNEGFLSIPFPLRKGKVSISKHEDQSIPSHASGGLETNQQILVALYESNNQQAQGILRSITPATAVRYVIRYALSLVQKGNMQYAVPLAIIATSYQPELSIYAFLCLRHCLTCIKYLDVQSVSEVKKIYDKLVIAENYAYGRNVEAEVALLVIHCCMLCANLLLVYAVSCGDNTELQGLIPILHRNIDMTHKWTQDGILARNDLFVSSYSCMIKEIFSSVKTIMELIPSKREKLCGLLTKLMNYRKENKSVVSAVVKTVNITTKLAILTQVSSLVSAKSDMNYKELLKLIHKDIMEQKMTDIHLLVVLQATVSCAENVNLTYVESLLMQGLLKNIIDRCRKVFSKEDFEKYVPPTFSPLLCHNTADMREFAASKILPLLKDGTTFQPRAIQMLEEFYPKFVQKDLLLYRVVILHKVNVPTHEMNDCQIYHGTFGSYKNRIEVVCHRQGNMREITSPTTSSRYAKYKVPIEIFQRLQAPKAANVPKSSVENIVQLLAFMCSDSGVNYYLLKTGSDSQCLSKYLKQKALMVPHGYIPLSKRLKYAKEMVSAILHCNMCEILVRDITACSFIVCKQNGERTVKLYNVEHAKSKNNGDDVIDTFYEEGEKLPTMWLAPESLYKHHYNTSTEAYSLAHAVIEVLSFGVHPYQEMAMAQLDATQKAKNVLKYRLLPERRPCIPEVIYIGLLPCFLKDPKIRTNIQGIDNILNSFDGKPLIRQNKNEDCVQVIRDLLKSQPDQPEKGLPKSLSNIGREEDFVDKDDMEKLYDGYVSKLDNSCVVHGTDLFCHDRPLIVMEGHHHGQQNLCIVKTHSSKEEQNLIRDICTGKDKAKYIASVKRYFTMPTKDCALQHIAVSLNVGRREPITDAICTQPLEESRRFEIYNQMAQGMKYLHDNGIIHCSLQGKNVYVSLMDENNINIVIGQLNRATQLKRDLHDRDLTEALVKPFDVIPGDILRWCPLETLETRLMSVYSDVAQFGHTLWEIEHCSGIGDVPRKYLVPYSYIHVERLAEAHREKHMLLQPTGCPEWLDRLIKICVANPKCRRPLFDEILDIFRDPMNHEVLYPKPMKSVLKRRQSIIDDVPECKNKKLRSARAKVVSSAFGNEDDEFFKRGTIQYQRSTPHTSMPYWTGMENSKKRPNILEKFTSWLSPDKRTVSRVPTNNPNNSFFIPPDPYDNKPLPPPPVPSELYEMDLNRLSMKDTPNCTDINIYESHQSPLGTSDDEFTEDETDGAKAGNSCSLVYNEVAKENSEQEQDTKLSGINPLAQTCSNPSTSLYEYYEDVVYRPPAKSPNQVHKSSGSSSTDNNGLGPLPKNELQLQPKDGLIKQPNQNIVNGNIQENLADQLRNAVKEFERVDQADKQRYALKERVDVDCKSYPLPIDHYQIPGLQQGISQFKSEQQCSYAPTYDPRGLQQKMSSFAPIYEEADIYDSV